MNQNEFMHLVAPFQSKLFRLAKRLLISVEEAEDAAQEVLVKLWKKKTDLYQYNSVEALAMTMTKNFCLDQLKSKRAQNLQIVHSNYAENNSGLQKNIEDKDSLSWVEKIVNQLPEKQKIIIQLRDIEQLEYDEIAKITEMNQTAVRVALSRARKTIRENMTKMHHYGIE
jgi:RNA polymerase sigma-70 factor (ECF subfamily)